MNSATAPLTDPAAQAAINAACGTHSLPGVAEVAAPLTKAAARQRLTHASYLAEVLIYGCEQRDERRRARRIKEVKFPRPKRLKDFDATQIPDLPAATLAHLATGTWIDKGEPLVLLGDSGTGKTHLLIALGTAAAEQGRRLRYTPPAALVNELVEAADGKELSRIVGRYARLDLLCLDEVGYVKLDPRGAELLFQIITAREERASVACALKRTVQRVGPDLHRPQTRRRRCRPADLSRAHHQHRNRVLPAENNTTEQEDRHQFNLSNPQTRWGQNRLQTSGQMSLVFRGHCQSLRRNKRWSFQQSP